MDEAIRYVIAASEGLTYKYPEGWDNNMNGSIRKQVNRVTVRGVEVVCKKKDKAVCARKFCVDYSQRLPPLGLHIKSYVLKWRS